MTALDPLPVHSGLSPAVQDYLRAIYTLARRGPADARVTTSQLADWLGFRPASVTAMLQKMAAAEPALVEYEKHQGVRLTADGERAAIALVRHHRLLELFLQEKLGYSWDEVHDEADRLEHVVSDELAERMAAVLGNPTRDPHGHAIPGVDLTPAPASGTPLDTLAPGQRGTVLSVRDEDPALLRRLAASGLRPGAAVTLVSVTTGVICLKIDGQTLSTLDNDAAAQVIVELH
jgi:DtxR family Mn-dependent transcriptional regulator